MSSNSFTKENLDSFFKELSKAFRKINGKYATAEIILVGGAAILTNYNFRDATTDVDAIIRSTASMKEAINQVGDAFNLPNGWLNADFTKTASYSQKLIQFSVPYKTFNRVLDVRTVKAEYLVAMKLRSGRKYKNDLSDIIGILAEHEKQGSPINIEEVNKAVVDLYGGWEDFPHDSKSFIEDAMVNGNFDEIYTSVKTEEIESKDLLQEFEKDYPKVAKESNVNDIIANLKNRKKQ